MRIRTVVLVTLVFLVFITAATFFSNNGTIFSELPESRVEVARREALQKPFLQRAHRVERKARLEKLFDTPPLPTAGLEDRINIGSTLASQRLQKTNRATAEEEQKRAKYHVIPSVDGSIYTEWQVRVCYYWYRKMKARYPDSAMGGFTRLLHSGKADNLTDEIPTAIVNPLPKGVDQGYVVLNRPFAFLQWVQEYLPSIPEDYVFMAEPDHLFVRPPPLWATPTQAAAFPFSYMTPKKHADLLNRFNGKNVSIAFMAPIGNSPVQIHRRQLTDIVEKWHNISLRMKNDTDVDKAFGWILEMYAFSIASSQAEGGPIVYELHRELMGQPPFDDFLETEGRPICIVHLTYGLDYDKSGRMVYGQIGDYFHWDKRDYSHKYPPRNITLPQRPVSAPAVDFALSAINEASANLPWRA